VSYKKQDELIYVKLRKNFLYAKQNRFNKHKVLFNVGVIYFSKVFFQTFTCASEAKGVLVSYKKTRYVADTVKSSENLVIKTKQNTPFYVNDPLLFEKPIFSNDHIIYVSIYRRFAVAEYL
jgi:hypothetical protein